MSIASELSALNGYILGAYDEINDKGGDVPANKNMANLASAIASISTGTSTTITPIEVTENGTYTAPTGTAYSPVTVNVSGSGGSFDLSAIPNLTGVASKICKPISAAYFNMLETPQLPSGANIRLLIVAPVDDITFSGYILRSLFYLSYGTDSGEFALTNDTYSFAWWSYGTDRGQINWWRMGAVSPSSSYTYKAPAESNWWGRILEHYSGDTSWRPYMPYASYSTTGSAYQTKLVMGANYLVVVGW